VPPYSETQEYVRRIGRRYSLIRDPEAAANAMPLQRRARRGEAERTSETLGL